MDEYAFLHVPTNSKFVIPHDDTLHPLYRPLWPLQNFLKSTFAKRTHRFWSYVLAGLEEIFDRHNKTLWVVNMLRGERLPFQVREVFF